MVPNRFAYVGVVSKITGEAASSSCAKSHVYAIYAERVAILHAWRFGEAIRNIRHRTILRTFAFAFFKRVEIVQQMVAHFFEKFGDAGTGIFLF